MEEWGCESCKSGRETVDSEGNTVNSGATGCRKCQSGWYDDDGASSTACVACAAGYETREHRAAENPDDPDFCFPKRWIPARCSQIHDVGGWEYWQKAHWNTAAGDCNSDELGDPQEGWTWTWKEAYCPGRKVFSFQDDEDFHAQYFPCPEDDEVCGSCIEDICGVVTEGAQFCDACVSGFVDDDDDSSTACVESDADRRLLFGHFDGLGVPDVYVYARQLMNSIVDGFDDTGTETMVLGEYVPSEYSVINCLS